MTVALASLAPVAAQAADPKPPSLIVAISVDQFSADLFAQYRATYSGGLKRLSQGVVFPKGYQSHAATETCPGHSTILTGNRPGHTGIIANNWVDQSVTRDDKKVYCAEDPSVPGSSSKKYTPSLMRLKVPTLGDRMKAADPETYVAAVSGKDRAALMMGGPKADQIWWWSGKGFATLPGRPSNAVVDKASADAMAEVNRDQPAYDLPAGCAPLSHAVSVSDKKTVGTGRFARKAGAETAFRTSPELDAQTLALAGALLDANNLGRRGHTDVLAISLSATDYVGHTYGPGGGEMCIQQAALDTALGAFLDRLDKTGIDYVVVLTADHGGHDTPERNRENAAPDAVRIEKSFTLSAVNAELAKRTKVKGPLFLAESEIPNGDLYLRRDLSAPAKKKVLKAAVDMLGANPQVAAVFTHAELATAPEPSGPPEAWSLRDEFKASFDPERSGDLLVALKPRVTPIPDPDSGAVATHGSPWDYDRRVPILFWRKGIVPFEQPLGVETVDIMPTLASLISLPLPAAGIDGRCLDLISGPATNCPAK
jgi:predicted AlkP superfamily pyrophosphatase or phosphodiesterase